MGIVDGQPVDAANSNPAWLDANADDTDLAKLSLDDQAPGASTVSGAAVSNVQKNINSIAAFTGWILNGVYNLLPTWATNNRGSSTNTLKQRIEAIDTAFDPSSGHKHTGAAGDAPQVSAATLTNLNYYRADMQVVQVVSVTGASMVVTTNFSGKTPGGSTAALGVITTAPYNRVEIRDSNNGDQIEDPSGNKVYGRLTYSSGVWTMTFYVFDSGTETGYTIPASYSTNVYFLEVFNLNTIPTIPAALGALGSLDATADIVDATATQRGVVSVVTQTFGGLKIFKDLMALIDTITTSFYLTISSASSVALTANRTLLIDVMNGSRSLIMAANLTVSGTANVSGTNTGDQTIILTGQVTGSGTGSFATTIATNTVTNSNLAQMAAHTFKGNNTALTANTLDLSASQLTAELDLFTSTLKGLVPLSGGGTTNFLRADGSWAAPPGTTAVTTMTAFGSTPNANGASISGVNLTLQPADASNPGGISVNTQDIPGKKNFNAGVLISSKIELGVTTDSTTTGSTADIPDGGAPITRMTNASLVSVRNWASPVSGQQRVLMNVTGTSITVINDAGGTAANRFITGTGADLTLANNASIIFQYDPTTARWRVIGGSGSGGSSVPTIFGSRGTPRSVVAATGITSGASHMSTTAATQDIYVEGSVTGDSICATITAGTIDGQRMCIIGRTDLKTLTIDSTTTNVAVKGPKTLGADQMLNLRWDTVNWSEVSLA